MQSNNVTPNASAFTEPLIDGIVRASAMTDFAVDATSVEEVEGTEETTIVDLKLPPVLSSPSLEATGAGAGDWILSVYSEKCFQCTGLNPQGTKDFTRMKCRSDRGNSFCPAGQIEVQIVGKRNRMLAALRRAQESGDAMSVIEVIDTIRSPEITEEDRTWVFQQAGLIPTSSETSRVNADPLAPVDVDADVVENNGFPTP